MLCRHSCVRWPLTAHSGYDKTELSTLIISNEQGFGDQAEAAVESYEEQRRTYRTVQQATASNSVREFKWESDIFKAPTKNKAVLSMT